MGPEALCFFVVRPSVCMCLCALHVFACIHVESFSTSLLSTSSCICIADQCRFAYFVVIILFCIYIRDVNSREITFPGQELQFPGLYRDSRFRPITYFYLHDRSWIASGGADLALFPADAGTPLPPADDRRWPHWVLTLLCEELV